MKKDRRGGEPPVTIHFEFDDYEGDLMLKEEPKKYILWRMVPPGTFRYFISIKLM